ncbi:MAG TPA: adenosylcobinamide-GDP ribazoletransferase [Streptosporangiaceae bacterium]|nr:adenosylcobinamide-GDP ribazoletransferase [Streptosporangiaceae bacterium]
MIWDGFRLAVGLLTAIPVRTGRAGRASGADGAGTGGAGGAGTGGAGRTGGGWSVSRQTAAAAMAWAPAVGLALGVAAAAVLVGADRLLRAGPLLAAVLAVVTLALLTRGLHLDGLADLADGLGSGRTAPAALEIMKRSDIGPFGVTTLVLTLFVQVAALAQAQARGTASIAGHGPAALVAATVTGRLAITWACRRAVPAARPDGLGALVAGTLPTAVPAVLTTVALGLAALCGRLLAAPSGDWLLPAGIAAGLAVSLALTGHAVRRLGGITGDVLGGLSEIATTVCLIVAAV